MTPIMIQFIKNIWNAQRNAAELELTLRNEAQLASEVGRLYSEVSQITFSRDQYSALTATLANEYLLSLGMHVDVPDSIREAHMLRGVATNWKYADDIKYGKPMWDKRQRMEEKRKVQDAHLNQQRMLNGESQMGNRQDGPWATPDWARKA